MTFMPSGARLRFARSGTRSSGYRSTRGCSRRRAQTRRSASRACEPEERRRRSARALAFAVDETRELIVREVIAVSAESVELLVERSEGWPAGLYLAALWLRDLENPNEGVRAFVGSTRPVSYTH